MPIISGGKASGGGSSSPGFEVGYDQITAPVTVSSVTEATGTTVITCGAHTFDGSPVVATFFCGQAQPGDAITVSLFEAATQITRLAVIAGGANISLTGSYRFTPTAGSHTYTVTAFRASSNGTLQAGAGGTGATAPCFIRFVKV